MPLNISFILIAFFIWIAENISTFFGAWQYPDQVHVWNVVSTQKITSWFLMVIISFIIVASLKKNKKHDKIGLVFSMLPPIPVKLIESKKLSLFKRQTIYINNIIIVA